MLMHNKNVISYASHLFNVHERNYPAQDSGLKEVVLALKILRHYLYGLTYLLINVVCSICSLKSI